MKKYLVFFMLVLGAMLPDLKASDAYYSAKNLIKAAKQGDLIDVTKILGHKPKLINEMPTYDKKKKKKKATALYLAAKNNHVEIVKYLLKVSGVDVEKGKFEVKITKELTSFSPVKSPGKIFKEIMVGPGLVLVGMKRDEDTLNIKETPLFVAIVNSNIEIIDLLLKKRASIHQGMNILHKNDRVEKLVSVFEYISGWRGAIKKTELWQGLKSMWYREKN